MATSVRIVIPGRPWEDLATGAAKTVLRPLQLWIAAPSALFLVALTAMLMRPPVMEGIQIDRIALVLLVVGVAVRAVALRQRLFVFERATWPMLCLTLLALVSVAGQPFEDGSASRVGKGAEYGIGVSRFHRETITIWLWFVKRNLIPEISDHEAVTKTGHIRLIVARLREADPREAQDDIFKSRWHFLHTFASRQTPRASLYIWLIRTQDRRLEKFGS